MKTKNRCKKIYKFTQKPLKIVHDRNKKLKYVNIYMKNNPKMINIHIKIYLTSLIIKVSLNVSLIILMMIKNINNAQIS